MDFWFYIYLVLVLVFVIGAWCIWAQCTLWWNASTAKTSRFQHSHFYEIFLHENAQHHLLRSYALELQHNLDCAKETVTLYTENTQTLLKLWEKLLNKGHFNALVERLRKRWSLHRSLVENDGESDGKTEQNALRAVNRKIAQINEDGWGLKFDGSGYMKALNDLDGSLVEMLQCIDEEEYTQHMEHFHSLLFHQETAENKMKLLL